MMSEMKGSAMAFGLESSKYRLKDVLLDDLSVVTAEFGPLKPKKISLKFSVSTVDDWPMLRLTDSSLEMLDADGETLVEIKCSFKTDFVLRVDDAGEELLDDLNAAAVRISYPYHRQMLSDLTGRLGLKSTFLPAVPDDLWRAGMNEAKPVSAKV